MIEQFSSALEDYKFAAELAGDSATYHTDLADAYQFLGRWQDAARSYQRAVAIDNKYARAYQNAAWLMATCPDKEMRNPSLALAAARKAIDLEGEKSSATLDTLAAATATSGRHTEAVEILREAMQLAQDETEREELSQRLHLYEQGAEYRQPQPLQSALAKRQAIQPMSDPAIRTASTPSR